MLSTQDAKLWRHFNMNQNQQGFTLIELMVALSLGLLVSAAAIQLFITSQKSAASQQGMMNLQNSSIFGLETMVRDIRQANLRAREPYMDDKTVSGGVVLTANNLSTYKNAAGSFAFNIDPGLLSKGNAGSSNLQGLQSDQLVIQYRVNGPNHFDCEGNSIPANTFVVQRYFVRADTKALTTEPNAGLALACKAARYLTSDISTKATLTGLDGAGQIIIPRVDHFSVLLGVAKDGMNAACNATATSDAILDCFGYVDLETYKSLTTKPQIVSVKIAILVRSMDTVGRNEFFDKEKVYKVLNRQAVLKEHDRNNQYLRSVVSQTIALRNGFGIEK